VGHESEIEKKPPPGYFATQAIINDLQRFQNLLRHHQRWATQIDFAPPIEQLIPDITDTNQRWLIEREINRLIPIIKEHLKNANIGTAVTKVEEVEQYDFEKNIPRYIEKEDTWNLIDHYFDHRGQRTFELQMQAIERAVGFYRKRLKKALWELFSPVHWVATILRLPLRVLELSGLETSGKMVSEIYAWIIRIGILIILGMIAARLGVNLPWDQIIKIR
jgi:hypothetical protein